MDPESIVIRRATARDLSALNALTQASSAYDGAYRAMLDGYEITEAQIARDSVHLAEGGARVLGYYSLILSDPPELDLMFVADDAQGLGLGARLFAHMLDEARAHGAERVTIVSHPPSVGFYERMGARRVGVRAPRGRITWDQPILEAAT